MRYENWKDLFFSNLSEAGIELFQWTLQIPADAANPPQLMYQMVTFKIAHNHPVKIATLFVATSYIALEHQMITFKNRPIGHFSLPAIFFLEGTP